jgi:hypothetical protein
LLLESTHNSPRLHFIGPLLIELLDKGNVFFGLMQCLSCVVVFVLYGEQHLFANTTY